MHRRNKLKWVLASLVGIAGLLAAVAPWNAGASTAVVRLMASRQAASGAQKYIGHPYMYGGTGPSAFDCSGLAQYVYRNYVGVSIPRVAEDQFKWFRPETKAHAWGGDLIFFHSGSINGPVFHTGIYEGGNGMVSALSPQYGVRQTPISWGGKYYTFGTISH